MMIKEIIAVKFTIKNALACQTFYFSPAMVLGKFVDLFFPFMPKGKIYGMQSGTFVYWNKGITPL